MLRATTDLLYFETGPANRPTLGSSPASPSRFRPSSTAAPGSTPTPTAPAPRAVARR